MLGSIGRASDGRNDTFLNQFIVVFFLWGGFLRAQILLFKLIFNFQGCVQFDSYIYLAFTVLSNNDGRKRYILNQFIVVFFLWGGGS